MTDLCEKGSGSQDSKKTCVDCGTAKTPLWRGGPAGPKSLCNACGIKYRKKRRALMAMNKAGSQQEKKPTSTNEMIRSKDKENSKSDVSLKLRLLALGRQVWQRKSALEKHRQLGEEEQAAVLLMALSYGSIYS
ncbi:hypothetical protein ACHQM5_026368 [Ranunculus cassubicifolius]